MAEIKRYSLQKDGDKRLTEHFRVAEFACRDGSDTVLAASELARLLEELREELGPVTVNSAYRTPAYNRAVGGVSGSQHTRGTAADIRVSGVSPEETARAAERLMPRSGGIGLYPTFTHVDVRDSRSRWKSVNGRLTGCPGFPTEGKKEEKDEVTQEEFGVMMANYLKALAEQEPSAWSAQARAWAESAGVITGTGEGQKQYRSFCTREQLAQILYRLHGKN